MWENASAFIMSMTGSPSKIFKMVSRFCFVMKWGMFMGWGSSIIKVLVMTLNILS